MPDLVTVQQEDFDVSQELSALRAQDLRVGAVCSFVGTVRDTRALTGQAQDEVQVMELEQWLGLAQQILGETACSMRVDNVFKSSFNSMILPEPPMATSWSAKDSAAAALFHAAVA